MLVGRGADDPAHVGAAGEEDVVEAELQQAGGLRDAAGHHLDQLAVQVRRDQHLYQGGRGGGDLRRLDEDGVARRQRSNDGAQGELQDKKKKCYGSSASFDNKKNK